jgi:hypothetical protein
MTPTMPFNKVLEAADHLSEDEQHQLVDILSRRLAESARRQIAADIRESRKEFAEGRCTSATPDEIMREILK